MILIFDLDGTISDPSEGISASLNYALDCLGLPQKPPTELTKYIGPSLVDIFSDLLNTRDDAVIQHAISYFRKRYFDIGYKENVLYPEMKNILRQVAQDHATMYIATTKKTEIAKSVADFFGISRYFKEILGCGLKRKKVEIIEEIKDKEKTQKIAMIGDRFIDMTAGKSMGCFCVGVLWGFGSEKELKDSGADVLLHHPQELLIIDHLKKNHIAVA